jgi:hypothetical protein
MAGTQPQPPAGMALQKKPAGTNPPEAENPVVEVLENTLWNRTLGQMSEEIVAALVCQIFEGKAHLFSKG